MPQSIAAARSHIFEKIAAAALRAGRRPEKVRLVAVSKTVSLNRIREAADAGQEIFGENYLQEAAAKIGEIGRRLRWHFIGHLQSNKARQAAELFDMVETVDRLKVARLLNEHCQALDRCLDILVQINVGEEPQKSGVLPSEAEMLLDQLQQFPRLRVLGLMTIPPFFDAPEKVRPFYRKLRILSEKFRARNLLGRHGPVELSMGMSGDFESAIEEGATLVRVGTALFGSRH
ncbi:MAG: YggS family pyridoxal phosphate-dependent enzyme [Deltaproteobacteria bacterium]